MLNRPWHESTAKLLLLVIVSATRLKQMLLLKPRGLLGCMRTCRPSVADMLHCYAAAAA
jgi:hypothetical protein